VAEPGEDTKLLPGSAPAQPCGDRAADLQRPWWTVRWWRPAHQGGFQRAVVHRTYEHWRHRGRAGRRAGGRAVAGGRTSAWPPCSPGRPAAAGNGPNIRLRRTPARPRVTWPAA